jgi:hypothetical protein
MVPIYRIAEPKAVIFGIGLRKADSGLRIIDPTALPPRIEGGYFAENLLNSDDAIGLTRLPAMAHQQTFAGAACSHIFTASVEWLLRSYPQVLPPDKAAPLQGASSRFEV